MGLHLRRILVCAVSLFSIVAAPATAQSTHDEWLTLRTRKQARHHRLPGTATQPGAFTITVIRFFSDASGNLVGVGEARNDTSLDLFYSRINFRFLDSSGAELGREWTYLHGGVNAQIVTSNAYETLLVPGAIGFFKIWTTIPASMMASYRIESAGESLPYAKPRASLGLPDWRPERWLPLVYTTAHRRPAIGQLLSGVVWNDDPWDPNCPCGHQHVFTSSVQVSMAAYHKGVIADVQSVFAVGSSRTAQCTEPQATGITLHETAPFTIAFSRPVDSIRWQAVEWDENERPATISPYIYAFSFEDSGGEGSFTVDPWCEPTSIASPPWVRVLEASQSDASGGRVRFSVESNPGPDYRYGSVTVRGASVRVIQRGPCPQGMQTRILGPGRMHETFISAVRSACLAGSVPASDADWLRISVVASSALYVSAEPNFTGSERTGVVQFGARTFTFHQRPASRSLDLNGDGHLDLLWHHRTGGWIAAWRMRGLQMIDGTLLSQSRVPDVNWTPVAAADLDRNFVPDVIWQNHATGAKAIWRLAGTDVVGTHYIPPWFWVAPPPWKLRAVSDLNRDGDPDFIWQHEGTGQIEAWYMPTVPPPPFPTEFVQWSAPPPSATVPLGPGTVTDLNWKIVGSGDMNLDGWADLVWQHQTDGRVAVWKMKGTMLDEAVSISPGRVADLDWKIRAVGDINGDDWPDLIWQHRTDGRVAAWLMNGTTVVSGVVIARIADTNWEIVGPR